MIRTAASLVLVALTLAGLWTFSQAQSGCTAIAPGAVLTAGQWNNCFAGKVDYPFAPTATRTQLAGPTTYYATTTGLDTNVCSQASPCLTAQRLITLLNGIDNAGFNVTLSLADGSYGAGLICNSPFVGSGTVTLLGDTAAPTSVVLNNGATGSAVLANNGCQIILNGMRVKGSGDLINAQGPGSQILVSNMDFTATSTAHLVARINAFIKVTGPTSISGGGAQHYEGLNNAALTDSGNTITFTNSVTFTDAFATTQFNGSMKLQSSTYSLGGNTVTGPKFDANSGGVIFTSGACTSLPGSTSGTTATQGQCL